MHNVSESASTPVSRRTFVLGAAATGLLAACGSDDGAAPADSIAETTNLDGTADDTADSATPPVSPVVADEFAGDSADLPAGSYNVIQRFPPNVQEVGNVRLPFSLNGGEANLISDGPLVLGAQIVDLDGNPIGPRIEAVRRDVAPASYYAFRTTIDTAGFYGILIDGGPETGANFQILEAGEAPIPHIGQPMPAFDTPTFDAPGDVDPICTRDPMCEFHDVTLTDALAAGGPVAYFIGTPQFCQTGSCTPALEAIIDVADSYAGSMTFVHAEVFADATASALTPAVLDLAITFEPALYITSADGTIVDRLDGLWDVSELRETLDAALA